MLVLIFMQIVMECNSVRIKMQTGHLGFVVLQCPVQATYCMKGWIYTTTIQ